MFEIDNTPNAPYCRECRALGYDNSKEFVDMCDSCQDNVISKTFRTEKDKAVENYILDNH
jgi:hypothetical protein